jgi:hypothetical protein
MLLKCEFESAVIPKEITESPNRVFRLRINDLIYVEERENKKKKEKNKSDRSIFNSKILLRIQNSIFSFG